MTIETRTGIKIDAATLLAALDTCLAFTAKDDNRPVLRAVRIESTATGTKFVSADGYHLGIVDLAASIFGEIDTLIHSDSVKTIVKMLKTVGKNQRERVMVTLDDRQFEIPNVGTIPVTVVPGTFPDYEKLVPEVETQVSRTDRFALNPGMLLKAATVANRYSSGTVMRFNTPASRGKPISASWNINDNMSVRYVLMPMNIQWADGSN